MKIESAVLSIIGEHAGEPVDAVIQRKRDDIKKAGRTIWLFQSHKARIPTVQQFGLKYPNPAIIFLKGNAYPTGTADQARQMSDDKSLWNPLPIGISKVTGKLPGVGLIIGELTPVDEEIIDLWKFLEYPALQPIKFQQGGSTTCAVPSQDGSIEGMKNHLRDVVAVGRLVPPYGVYLRR